MNHQSEKSTNNISPNWLSQSVRWLIYVLFLSTPFIFTWVNEELFEFPKIIWFYSLISLSFGLSLADQLIQRSWSWPKSKFDWLVLAFGLSQLFSTILSIHPRTSWFGYYTRFNGGFLSVLSYITLYYLLIKYFNSKQLIRLAKTIILIAGLVALYALPEHFGFSPSCALITKTYDVSCWVQDVKSRVFGTFGQPNWLAAYFISILPLVTAWFLTTKQAWKKTGLGIIWAMLLTGVLFTQSRSGIIGLGVGLGVWLSLVGWQKFWQKKSGVSTSDPTLKSRNQSFWPGLSLVGLGLGLILWFGTPFSPTLTSLIAKTSNSELVTPTPPVIQSGTKLDLGGTESGEIRKIVWSGALAVWRRYPIFGSGVETFAYSYYQDRLQSHNFVSEWDFLYNKAHNELLNYLATTGLVGLLAYLSLWAGITWLVLGWLRSQPGDSETKTHKLYAIAWMSGLAAQFVSNFFGFSTVMINLLWWLGMASIVTWTQSKSRATPTTKPISLNLVELSALSLIIIATWWASTRPLAWWQADKDFATSKALFTGNTYQAGLLKLENAIKLMPKEALYWDELANQYSRLAVGLQASPDASLSGEIIAQLTQAAIAASDQTLVLNPRHLDFYKTRARVFINLSQIDPKYLNEAIASLKTAEALAPTDPKLPYHLGLVELTQGSTTSALLDLEKSVSLKPNYLSAWFDLGKAYDLAKQPEKASQTYKFILQYLAPDNLEVTAELNALNLRNLAK